MSQVGALVGLRWRMIRDRRSRLGLSLGIGLILGLGLSAVLGGQAVPGGDRLFDLLLLAPTVFLVFAALSLVAPVVAGGGNEFYPDGQLVAYPITSRTTFLTGLLISPLNLAWITQVLMLIGITAAVAARGPLVVLALVTAFAYIALVTVAAQSLAWASVGLRGTRRGRSGLFGALGIFVAGAAAVVVSGRTTDVLDRVPTRQVVLALLDGAQGKIDTWLVTTSVLALMTVAALFLGVRACDWALRQPPPPGRPELSPVVRRQPRATAFLELVSVDAASVWRSTPLRRGLLVLAVLPGGVAFLADPTWPSLTLLPGLVAAGAGLLFGVNAFCLDGNGAVWVSTLPHPPRWSLLSKLVVVGATCLGTVLLALLVAALRIDGSPSAAEAIAVLGSTLGASLVVVATCARLSVTRPHKADLRGPRDTPAPPGTMAVYSARLALGTTWVGLLLAGAGASGSAVAAISGTCAVAFLALRSLSSTLTRWQSVTQRAHVITKVSYG